MLQTFSIIGCGRVGFNLAIRLAQEKVKHINLYDFDVITSLDNVYNIKTEDFIYCYKVDVLKYLIKSFSDNYTSVTSFKSKVVDSLKKDNFIIDCRDKKNYINSDLEISLDGYILHLNSNIIYKQNYNRIERYIFQKNKIYLKTSLEVIINYLKQKEYEKKEFKEYDLINGKSYIISI